MKELLDDPIEFKPVVPAPDFKIAVTLLSVFIFLLVMQFYVGTSETALVTGSYFWMPFLIAAICAFIVPPKRALLLGFLTVPVTFVFYEILWPLL